MKRKTLVYIAFVLYNAIAFSAWGQRDSLWVAEAKTGEKIERLLKDYQALNRIDRKSVV